MKKLLTVLCLGLVVAFSVTFAEPAAATSPKCSGTAAYGKIKYQVCIRYNCDSNSCLVKGYLGLINTATSSRAVNWQLDIVEPTGERNNDDFNTAVLAAGEQRTIYSRWTTDTANCGGHFQHTEALWIMYGGSDWSPLITVTDTLFCA